MSARSDAVVDSASDAASAAAPNDLRTIALASPVLQMLSGVDTPDGAVCGIDGVCVVPDSSSTSSTTK